MDSIPQPVVFNRPAPVMLEQVPAFKGISYDQEIQRSQGEQMTSSQSKFIKKAFAVRTDQSPEFIRNPESSLANKKSYADPLNIETIRCDGKARESSMTGISQKYGPQGFGTPQFEESFATPVKKDYDQSIDCIESPARHGSPGQELDAAQDSGWQIDLTKNLKRGPTLKGKIPMAPGISKEKKQPTGIVKKLQAECTNPNLPILENFGKPASKIIDTEGKKLAIENPEAKQNKAKIIKVGKIQQKTGLTIVRDETPTPYNYYHH